MSDSFPSPLVDDLGTFRELGHLAVDFAADYLETLRERPVFTPMTPDERQELLTLDLSEEPATNQHTQEQGYRRKQFFGHAETSRSRLKTRRNCTPGPSLRREKSIRNCAGSRRQLSPPLSR